ncbi:MAG: hypothetical protein LWX70_13130 [Sphingobacteriia bacterium]|nr:hypothetical protein [Sphingobacteriia bacterium]
MTNIKEENFDTICKRIQELVDLLESGASTLTQEQWDDIVKRIAMLK